MADKQSDSCLQ